MSNKNTPTKSPYNAIRNGNIGTLRKQLDEGLGVNERGGLLLRAAVQAKNLEAVEELLKRGANPNLSKPRPLEAALIMRVDSAITRALLKAGAKIMADDMFLAAEKGNIPNMEALIEYGGNVNEEEEIMERISNPLKKAIRANQKNMAEFLIKKGAKMPPDYVNTESYESRFYKTLMESLKGGRKTRRSKRSARKTRRRR
jgi:ankyrin repeat protein